MRSSLRVALCGAAFALAFVGARANFGGVPVLRAAGLAQFGGAVLVGDGEVFAGESNNQFRSGLVYVYRKTGASWTEAMQLAAPKAAVSDGFGSSLAIDGSTLFIGAGASAVHVFTKQGTMWTYSSTVDAATVPMPPAATPPPPATPPAAGAPPAAPPAPPPSNVARFGAIAASGDWLLIGKEVAGGRGRGGPIRREPEKRGGVLTYLAMGVMAPRIGGTTVAALRYGVVGLLGAMFLYYGLKAVQLTEMSNRVWKRTAEYGLILSERKRLGRHAGSRPTRQPTFVTRPSSSPWRGGRRPWRAPP